MTIKHKNCNSTMDCLYQEFEGCSISKNRTTKKEYAITDNAKYRIDAVRFFDCNYVEVDLTKVRKPA